MENDLQPRLIPVDAAEAERLALRGFGVGLAILFFLVEWRTRARGGATMSFAWAGGACLALALAWPRLFRPIYRVWMPVVGVLARINLWLICGILYYLVVTPYGLFLRLLGFAPLELKLREKDSYWVEKPERDPAESARSIS